MYFILFIPDYVENTKKNQGRNGTFAVTQFPRENYVPGVETLEEGGTGAVARVNVFYFCRSWWSFATSTTPA